MASRQPYIAQRRTLLIVVEGDTEFAFCRYLKATLSRGQNLEIKIKPAHGGSPDKIVEFTRRHAKQGDYDSIAIVFDDDKPLTKKGQTMARGLKAQLFPFTPCIEGFFLRLMGRSAPKDSYSCKSDFHQHGLGEKEKLDHDAYTALFPSSAFPSLSANGQFAALVKLFSNL